MNPLWNIFKSFLPSLISEGFYHLLLRKLIFRVIQQHKKKKYFFVEFFIEFRPNETYSRDVRQKKATDSNLKSFFINSSREHNNERVVHNIDNLTKLFCVLKLYAK